MAAATHCRSAEWAASGPNSKMSLQSTVQPNVVQGDPRGPAGWELVAPADGHSRGLLLGTWRGAQGFPWDVVVYWTHWRAGAGDGFGDQWACPAIGLRPRPWPRLDWKRVEHEFANYLAVDPGPGSPVRSPPVPWHPSVVGPQWDPRPELDPWLDPGACWFVAVEALQGAEQRLGEALDPADRARGLRRLRDSAPWTFALSPLLRGLAAAELGLPSQLPGEQVLAALASAEVSPDGKRRSWTSRRAQGRKYPEQVTLAKRATYDHLIECHPGQGVRVLGYLRGDHRKVLAVAADEIAKSFSEHQATLDEDLVVPMLVPLWEAGTLEDGPGGAQVDHVLAWLAAPHAAGDLALVLGGAVRRLAFFHPRGSAPPATSPSDLSGLLAAARVATLPSSWPSPHPVLVGVLHQPARGAGEVRPGTR